MSAALRFYRREAGRRVAARFLEEFERVVRLLEEQPGFGTPTRDGRWVYPMAHFPFSIIYREDQSAIRVLVVRHQHRDPDYGGSRR